MEEVVTVYRIHGRNPRHPEGVEKSRSPTVGMHQLRLKLSYEMAQLEGDAGVEAVAEELNAEAGNAQGTRLAH
jgi:hypothetical protein